MATTDPTRDNITTPDDIRFRDFARSLTTYAMHASPERIAQMMERAYGDHGPDSYKRWREQQAAREHMQRRQASPAKVEAVNAKAVKTKVKARRLLSRRRAARPLRGLVKATCAYEPCSKPFERQTYNHRFCSPRCYRRADRLRHLALQPTGDPAAVGQECSAALARLGALMAREEVGR